MMAAMPVRPDPIRPDWRVLTAADGTPVGRFLPGERDGRPLADLFELDTAPAAAARVIRAELAGWRIAGTAEPGLALIAAGGTARRHAHVYTHDLHTLPPVPDGFLLAPLDRPAEELAPVLEAAFPPGHPDFTAGEREDPLQQLRALLSGERFGPLLPCSGVALGADDRVTAAIVVNQSPGDAPLGGPWVALVFRAPGHPGTGRALLARALRLAARDRLPALGLAVSEGNPAVRVYEALGFRRILSSMSVDL
jgi:GNAT superfamily N-acetyltransferase